MHFRKDIFHRKKSRHVQTCSNLLMSICMVKFDKAGVFPTMLGKQKMLSSMHIASLKVEQKIGWRAESQLSKKKKKKKRKQLLRFLLCTDLSDMLNPFPLKTVQQYWIEKSHPLKSQSVSTMPQQAPFDMLQQTSRQVDCFFFVFAFLFCFCCR